MSDIDGRLLGVHHCSRETSGSHGRGAPFSFVLSSAMSAPRVLLARPRQVSESLSAEASLLDLAALHAPGVPVTNKETGIHDPLCPFSRVEPDAERCKLP